MSEMEQAKVIGQMEQLEEKDRSFLLGVMAGLTAKHEQKGQKEEEPVCEACRVKWPGEQ